MIERKRPVTVSVENYEAACNDYLGWCPDCQDFTREQTEPDAEGYDCEVCGGNEVVGAEQALLLGLIDVQEDE